MRLDLDAPIHRKMWIEKDRVEEYHLNPDQYALLREESDRLWKNNKINYLDINSRKELLKEGIFAFMFQNPIKVSRDYNYRHRTYKICG